MERIGKTAAIFNKNKLDWMNGIYLRKLSPEEFVQQATPFLSRDLPSTIKRPLDEDYIRQVMPLIQERARTLTEVPQLADFFFLDELQYDTSLLLSSGLDLTQATTSIEVAIQKLEIIKDWKASSLESILRPLSAELNLSTAKFFGLLRVAITGRTAAPPLFQTMAVLGRERCLERLRVAWRKLARR